MPLVRPLTRPITQPITNRITDGIRRGAAVPVFSPASLFASGEQGAWYDPSDFSTLFQDAAGTTPVTAVEQPVGLMLDKHSGLALGVEQIVNGDFATDTVWTKGAGVTISGGVCNYAAVPVSGGTLFQNAGIVGGATYKVTIDVVVVSGSIQVRLNGVPETFSPVISVSGSYTFYLTTTGTATGNISITVNTTFTGTLDNFSAKLLPGNHAIQATAASRPVLSARKNLLTFSEQFDNAAWALNQTTITSNTVLAPDGTTTGDFLQELATNNNHDVNRTTATFVTAGITATYSYYVQGVGRTFCKLTVQDTSDFITVFNLSTMAVHSLAAGCTATITDVGGGWARVSVTRTFTGTSGMFRISPAPDDGSSGIWLGEVGKGINIWGAQVEYDTTLTAYQWITTATNYNAVGFPFFLRFDGVDDSLATASVDFSVTDKVSQFAGVLRGGTSTLNMSISSLGNRTIGCFELSMINPGPYRLITSCRGTATSSAMSADFPSLAFTQVLSAFNDLAIGSPANAVNKIRQNGVALTLLNNDPGPTGGGNFSATDAINIGRLSAGTWSGNIYSTIILGRTATPQEISDTETWVNGKTGAY